MLISVKNMQKAFGAEVILQDVSLDLDKGQSLVITGPSGSGKSTLLSLLGLLLHPTRGEFRFKGKNVMAMAEDERDHLRNKAFGFIFQSANLIGSLTVLDNVLVPALLARRSNLQSRAREILAELGLGHRLDYFPHELSVGQKRRAAVARALLLEPEVIFADEPTNDLDPERAEQLGQFLFALPGRGTSLVLVTHDVRLAAGGERVMKIKEGVLFDITASATAMTEASCGAEY